jgi:hypothetical protein
MHCLSGLLVAHFTSIIWDKGKDSGTAAMTMKSPPIPPEVMTKVNIRYTDYSPTVSVEGI